MAPTDLTESRSSTLYLASQASKGTAVATPSKAPGTPAVDELLGQTLGSFKILSLLGEGGMGRVYLAEHVLIGRRAAVKVLAEEISGNAELVSRFFTEARAVNDIRHPNIVEVTDFGTFGSQPYIVMELLDGETLEARLARVRMLDVATASRLVAQIAAAVGAGHEHGMVHRDLKPANIFLRNHPDYPDFVKVLDFGIAKLVAADRNVHHHTEVGTLIGTPAYMSPEQCLGDTHLDHRSDIYSLGVVLYQMVTGRLPFTAETAGRLIMSHVQETPQAPHTLNSGISPSVSAVILRAMAKRPDQRFSSMRELREAMGAAASAEAQDQGARQAVTPAPVAAHAPPVATRPAADDTSMAATTYRPATPAVRPATPAVPPPAAVPTTHGSGKMLLVERLVELSKERLASDTDVALPEVPRSIARCLDHLDAPDFSFGGMASLLSHDFHLASQIVQIANTSGMTRTLSRSTEQAIARLGAEGVRTALLEIALKPVVESPSLRIQAVCKQPWQHALAVAILAQRLVHARGASEKLLLDAYRGGLFHDAGKVTTANLLFDLERQLAGAKGRRVLSDDLLAPCLDRAHGAVSARLGRSWGISPESASAIEEAARPAGQPPKSLGSVLRLANALAFKAGFHTRRDELDRSRVLADEARRAAGFDEETCHRALEGLKDAIARKL